MTPSKRLNANRLIVKSISEAVEKHPDLRFHQLLQSMSIESPFGDQYYEESSDTLANIDTHALLVHTNVNECDLGGLSSDLNSQLILAIINLHMAFPAGEYNFNERQNTAMNKFNDTVALLQSACPAFSDAVRRSRLQERKRIAKIFLDRGMITQEDYENEIKSVEDEEHAH